VGLGFGQFAIDPGLDFEGSVEVHDKRSFFRSARRAARRRRA
jgi:hypothetical protein